MIWRDLMQTRINEGVAGAESVSRDIREAPVLRTLGLRGLSPSHPILINNTVFKH